MIHFLCNHYKIGQHTIEHQPQTQRLHLPVKAILSPDNDPQTFNEGTN